MSRKVILTLAVAATVAAAALATSSASYARGARFGGGPSGPSHFASANHFARVNHFARLRDPRDPGRHIGLHEHEHHHHWAFRNGVWIEVEDADAVDTVDVAAPGPCTCLTKTYTPTGLVVFADICTKEAASAPVDNTADATQGPTTPPPASRPTGATAAPSNFAGRTYQEYLAANPQAATQAPAKN